MTKELEALQDLLSFAFVMSENMVGLTKGSYDKNEFVKKTYEYLQKYIKNFECRDILKQALTELQAIKEANPSKALRMLDDISYLVLNEIDGLKNKELWKSYFTTIKQALLKVEKLEKEKLLFKNLHNTKVKTPLCDIFNGLSQEERFKFTEHIYYNWEEIKEELETKIDALTKEVKSLKVYNKQQEEDLAKYKNGLEIIFKKNVNTLLLELASNVEEYNERIVPNGRLTSEEFKFLKDMRKIWD